MTNETLPQIPYDELIKNLKDPEKDLATYLQYMIEISNLDQMTPELAPNSKFVTDIPAQPEGGLFMGLANSIMRGRRHNAYKARIADGWMGHRIVSEGDSWFQFPTSLKDIIDHLMVDHTILSLGAAGDRLIEMQVQNEILINLKRERASALLLSAGGNDLFDNGKMGDLVEEPFPGATAEDLVGPVFKTFLREILGRYLSIFNKVHEALPHVHILTHGYSNAFPSGARWIEKPLTRRGVPKEIQHDIVKLMVKQFNDGLVKLGKRSEFNGQIEHVDLTKIGTKLNEWHNEIHLNGEAAEKAAEKFRKVLKRRLAGPAPETGHVRTVLPPVATTAVQQARSFAAFDEATLLDELDLRVSLLEMDPSVATEVLMNPISLGRSRPELGLNSMRAATKTLLQTWEVNLQDLLCGDDAETDQGKAVRQSVEKGKTALSGAIASWLITGPFGVPAALAGTLAAWLAGKVIDLGLAQVCARWKPKGPVSPAVGGSTTAESGALTFGELREKLTTPIGKPDLSTAGQKQRLELLNEVLAVGVVQNPRTPIGKEGGDQFLKTAKDILEMLGAEKDDKEAPGEVSLGVEAMVETDGSRPSVFVRDGFVNLDDPLLVNGGWRDEIVSHEADIRALIAASGRVIHVSDRSANSVYGSAWMLKDGRVATARHVIENMTHVEDGKLVLSDRFYVDFSVEADRPTDPTKVFRIAGVDWAAPKATNFRVNLGRIDAAILTLQPKDGVDFPKPLPLMTMDQSAEIAAEKWFINVGHPAAPRGSWLVDHDDENNLTITKAVLLALIGDKFGVKRLSPGTVKTAPGFLSEDSETKHVFTHDATTLGGSSGSGIMSLGPASMSGLHFAGAFKTNNYAHFVPALASDWSG